MATFQHSAAPTTTTNNSVINISNRNARSLPNNQSNLFNESFRHRGTGAPTSSRQTNTLSRAQSFRSPTLSSANIQAPTPARPALAHSRTMGPTQFLSQADSRQPTPAPTFSSSRQPPHARADSVIRMPSPAASEMLSRPPTVQANSLSRMPSIRSGSLSPTSIQYPPTPSPTTIPVRPPLARTASLRPQLEEAFGYVPLPTATEVFSPQNAACISANDDTCKPQDVQQQRQREFMHKPISGPKPSGAAKLPQGLKSFNISGDTWSSILSADSFTIQKHMFPAPARNIVLSVLESSCCCCLFPTTSSLSTAFTVYAGKGYDDRRSTLFRVDEVDSVSCCCFTCSNRQSTCLCVSCLMHWLSCCGCTDRRLEIRKHVPLPGDIGHSDFSHLADDIRAKFDAFTNKILPGLHRSGTTVTLQADSSETTESQASTATANSKSRAKNRSTIQADVDEMTAKRSHSNYNHSREIAVRLFYQKNPVLFTVRRDSNCVNNILSCVGLPMCCCCCTYDCSCLNTVPCFNCLPSGAISTHAVNNHLNSALQGIMTETNIICNAANPWTSAFSCCCLSLCCCCSIPHMEYRNELAEYNSVVSRVAQLTSICFYGNWSSEAGHNYHFPISFADSKLKKGDFGVVSKMKWSIWGDYVLCRVKFDKDKMSEISAEQKMTVLGTQLMLV
jgi:hypothetical protein